MKQVIPWVLLVVVICLWFGDRSSLKNDLAKVEKVYLEEKSIHETTIAMKDKEISEKEDKISEINGALDSANTVIANLEGDVQDALVDVAEARKGWEAFSLECRAKLKELDTSWSLPFSLAQEEIAKLKEQIKLADERDLLRQGEILDLRSIIDEKDKIISGCEAAQKDIVKACLKDKQKASLIGNVKSAVTLGLGFALGKL